MWIMEGLEFVLFTFFVCFTIPINVSTVSLFRHARYDKVGHSEFTCPGTKDQYQYYSHPDSCSKFYACTNGIAYISECVPGFLFHTGTTYCEREDIVNCTTDEHHHTKLTTSITSPKTTSDTNKISSSTTMKSTTKRVVTTTTTTKTPNPAASVDCTNEKVGTFLPDPTDCHTYFDCTNTGPVMFFCAPGTVFNADARICVTGNQCKHVL